MKRSPLKRRYVRVKPAEVIERDLWREGLGPCVLAGFADHVCEGKVRGHHVTEARTLKREGLHEFLWDKRNRMALCNVAHVRHHSAEERVPRRFITPAMHEFAVEVGLDYLLDRYYPIGEVAA